MLGEVGVMGNGVVGGTTSTATDVSCVYVVVCTRWFVVSYFTFLTLPLKFQNKFWNIKWCFSRK